MLVNLPVNNPGVYGLNTQSSAALLDMNWATSLENVVFDSNGNLSSRKGTKRKNSSPIVGTITQIFEYVDTSANSLIICSADTEIYKSVSTSLTSIVGTATTPTAPDWKFVNYNGSCIGAQSGHDLIILSSVSGSFSDLSMSGTAQPTSDTVDILPAFGRLWALDGQTLKYSNLLDETVWNSSYNLSSYWGNGVDIGVALAEFNGNIVVFGRNNVIFYNADEGPDSLVKVEVINGTGCIARDSVKQVGDDLWFLSDSGVKSLSRVVQEKSLPMRDISKNVRDYMLTYSTAYPIKSVYDEREGFYLLSFASAGIVFCFDVKLLLPDGSPRVSVFDVSWHSFCSSLDNTIYIGTAGYINTYVNYFDNVESDGSGGDEYTFKYYSPWTDLRSIDNELSARYKVFKKISATVFSANAQTLQFHWFKDFGSTLYRRDVELTPITDAFYWGVGLWGVDTWSTSVDLSKTSSSMGNTAKDFKFGIYANIQGEVFSLQSINIQAKIGRSII